MQLVSAQNVPPQPAGHRLPVHTRRAVLDAARIALRDTSFEQFDMQSVAGLASVSRRAVYNQFGTKEQLYRASRESLIFTLAGLVGDAIHVPQAGGLKYIARAAYEILSGPANVEIVHSIIRDGSKFGWLQHDYDCHVISPMVRACEILFLNKARAAQMPQWQPRAIAEHFIGTIDAMASGIAYLSRCPRVSAEDVEMQLELITRVYEQIFVMNASTPAAGQPF